MRKPKDLYPGQVDETDVGFPDGKAQNDSSPSDTDGTPLEKGWVNDVWGGLQALLRVVSIVPDGSEEKVGSSQIVTALTQLVKNTIVQFTQGAFAFAGTILFEATLQTDASNDLKSGRDITAARDAAVARDLTVGRNASVGGDFDAAGPATFADTLTANGPATFNVRLSMGPGGQMLLPNVILGSATSVTLQVVNSVVYWGAAVHPSALTNFALPNPAGVPTGSFILCCNYNSGSPGNVNITGAASGDVLIDNAVALFVTVSGVWRLMILT